MAAAHAVRWRLPPVYEGGILTSQCHAAGPRWQLRMLYDGDCPLCMREVNMLRRRDAEQGRIDFVDIASPDYSPRDNAGITYEQVRRPAWCLTYSGPHGNVPDFATLSRPWATYTPSRAQARSSPTSRCALLMAQGAHGEHVGDLAYACAGVQAPL